MREERQESGEEIRVSGFLKWSTLISFVVAMAVLLIGGRYNPSRVPPYPSAIVLHDGTRVDGKAIWRGQAVYQRYGLMDHGSVWGHGSQRGMDFSSQTLHFMGEAVRNAISKTRFGRPYRFLDREQQAVVDALTTYDIKENRYDPNTGELPLSEAQTEAFRAVHNHWERLFKHGDEPHGFLPNTIPTEAERRDLATFFFWTA
ncbi:MAG: hypothetical protein ACUVTZ_10600 [Armatimonadota bacterium]